MQTLFFSVTFGLAILSFSCADSSGKKRSAMNAGKGFAVVELFTSEGCSSCPPADNAVAKLLKENNSNVYVLGYHVDYWDNLGWRDIFSNAAYTQVQRNYAKAFKLSSAYTPQIIVNGTAQFVGSDEKKLNAAVNKSLQQPSTIQVSIDAKLADDHEVNVHYSINVSDASLQVALIQLSAENKIQRGENTGATLHHVNIVRDIKTVPAAASGSVALKIPGNLTAADCKVIAFAQDTSDNKISGATETGIK
ncbi:MAG TPA: DUF1223 domain-containing protein [Parafilimonas sp.]|nr:DUF1223 domain-containing protein [Parafilimonas sp.]